MARAMADMMGVQMASRMETVSMSKVQLAKPGVKSDVVITLSPKEAKTITIFFGLLGKRTLRTILVGDDEHLVDAVDTLTYKLYDRLDDLGYGE